MGSAGVADLVSALEAQDWDAASGCLASSYFGYEPGPDEPSAADRIGGVLGDISSAMSDLRVTLEDVDETTDPIGAVLVLSGTHDGALWGAPPTGRSISWRNPVSLRVKDDGLAIRFDDIAFPDLAALLREFGLVNPPDRMDEPPPAPVSAPDFLLKWVFTGQAGDKECSHLEEISVVEPSTRVCKTCYESGTNWPALRMCLICGHVGCCDTSKNKHAMAHYEETGHALMRSIRMDEGWVWCYADSAFFEKRILDRYR